MELEIMKKLIRKYEPGHTKFSFNAMQAERYYRNETDILINKISDERKEDADNPLRNADNRIPRNFHGLIVNQKAAYMFTAPPLFDIGNEQGNEVVTEVLGDEYRKNCMELCVNASNASVGWIHYWEDEDETFQWAVVDSKQIIPIESHDLKKKLLGVLRVYDEIDEETGDTYTIYEYWDKESCWTFRRKCGDTLENGLFYYNTFMVPDTGDFVAEYRHEFGEVPFIPFPNNNTNTNDLKNIKPLIDVYDKVYSGFINDLDDIQELIFVLSGYGGTDLDTFLSDLKKYKTIKVDGDDGSNPGVSTLNIEIPIEARNSVLEATRKAIFEQGQGFDPQPENFGNQSGEALKFMYSLLEMKAGLTETEFQLGFARLVRAICRHEGIDCKKIIQTWSRTCVKNDAEQAQICKDSVGIVSKKTILKNHPLVEDADAELKQLEKEAQEAQEKADAYVGAFNSKGEEKINEANSDDSGDGISNRNT